MTGRPGGGKGGQNAGRGIGGRGSGGRTGDGNDTPLARRRRAGLQRPMLRVKKHHRLARVLLVAVSLFSAIGATAITVAFAGYNIYRAQLPDAGTIAGMEPPQDSYVYDNAGNLVYVYHEQGSRHTHVSLANVSRWVKLATVDVEDRHFYEEGSWDVPRLIAAGVNNIRHTGVTQGASTITQQLAKLSFAGTTAPRSLDYKIKEIVLGNEIALNFTKDQVLEMYLNRLYYGNTATGIQTAAQLYFMKDASKLDLAESAMLSGLPQSPAYYNPLNHDASVTDNPAAKQRQLDVLQAMVTNGDITQSAADSAFKEKLTYHSWTESQPQEVPSFVDYLTSWLKAHYGGAYLDPGGWRIDTTLDLGKQRLAQTTVHDQVAANADHLNMHDASLVSINPKDGTLLAMVGTWDYSDQFIGQVNMALSPLDPGSTVKLFTYSAAIASGRFTVNTPIADAPFTFPVPGTSGYSPKDYDRRWHGTCPLKECLLNSYNMPAVKVEYATGVPYITNLELAAGVKSLNNTCPDGTGKQVTNLPAFNQWSATLGSFTCGINLLDLADAASTIAGLGVHHDVMPVLKISDSASGQVLFTYDPKAVAKRVLPENVAFIMDEVTSNDNNRQPSFGRNGLLTLPDRRVSAKTGTGEFFRDNLTMGWTPDLLTAVWVGNPVTSELYPGTNNHVCLPELHLPKGYPCGSLANVASGYSGAAPIWNAYMRAALKGTPAVWYTRPPDVVASAPGDNADFFLPGTKSSFQGPGCIYWGDAPDPSNPCQYVGTSPPTPTPEPTPPTQ
jgi:membrane peptidoglycan carboxypeptidase